MLDSQEQILQELDLTIDQLLYNASTLQTNQNQSILDPAEKRLLERTQESLLAKLLHTKELLDKTLVQSKRKIREQKLEAKIEQLKQLIPSSLEDFSKSLPYTPCIGRVRIGRNRKRHPVFTN